MADKKTDGYAAEAVGEAFWTKYLEPLLAARHEHESMMAVAASAAGDTLAAAKSGAVAVFVEELIEKVYTDAHGKPSHRLELKSEIKRVPLIETRGLWRPDQNGT